MNAFALLVVGMMIVVSDDDAKDDLLRGSACSPCFRWLLLVLRGGVMRFSCKPKV
jgi:hypothetical protein